MNGVLSGSLVAAALLLPALSHAQQAAKPAKSQFSYSYVELGYAKSDFEVEGAPDNIDGDGFTLSGSVKLSDEWHLYASDSSANLDFGINLDTWTLGLGYSHSLKPNIDLYGRVLYIDSAADLGATTSHDNGLGLQFRVRGRVNDKVEVEGGIQYIDVASSDTALQASVRYYFTRAFSAGVGVTFGGDADGLAINARYSF
jgi:hypothetical protein